MKKKICIQCHYCSQLNIFSAGLLQVAALLEESDSSFAISAGRFYSWTTFITETFHHHCILEHCKFYRCEMLGPLVFKHTAVAKTFHISHRYIGYSDPNPVSKHCLAHSNLTWSICQYVVMFRTLEELGYLNICVILWE